MLRPGAERVARLGGLHRFMDWPRPILTDSGGFQVMSLAALRKIDEDGVTFRSHLDGSQASRSRPERSMEIQRLLGSDIVMASTSARPSRPTRTQVAASMGLSMRWAERSRRRLRRARRGTRCSASSRAASIPICARVGRAR